MKSGRSKKEQERDGFTLTRDSVLEYLVTHGKGSTRDLMADLRMPSSSARWAVRSLVQTGQIACIDELPSCHGGDSVKVWAPVDHSNAEADEVPWPKRRPAAEIVAAAMRSHSALELAWTGPAWATTDG